MSGDMTLSDIANERQRVREEADESANYRGEYASATFETPFVDDVEMAAICSRPRRMMAMIARSLRPF